ncbi:hypothetical protein Bbelb_254900 [Branchiostoma belcheri]|nr:hypothetical protein Bbelb_254900 [Branchiostoma belcheri]
MNGQGKAVRPPVSGHGSGQTSGPFSRVVRAGVSYMNMFVVVDFAGVARGPIFCKDYWAFPSNPEVKENPPLTRARAYGVSQKGPSVAVGNFRTSKRGITANITELLEPGKKDHVQRATEEERQDKYGLAPNRH